MNENAEVIKNRTESGRVMRRLSNCSGNMMETCLLERFAEGKAIYLLLFPLHLPIGMPLKYQLRWTL